MVVSRATSREVVFPFALNALASPPGPPERLKERERRSTKNVNFAGVSVSTSSISLHDGHVRGRTRSCVLLWPSRGARQTSSVLQILERPKQRKRKRGHQVIKPCGYAFVVYSRICSRSGLFGLLPLSFFEILAPQLGPHHSFPQKGS